MFILIYNFMPAPSSGQDEAHIAFLINLRRSFKEREVAYTRGT